MEVGYEDADAITPARCEDTVYNHLFDQGPDTRAQQVTGSDPDPQAPAEYDHLDRSTKVAPEYNHLHGRAAAVDYHTPVEYDHLDRKTHGVPEYNHLHGSNGGNVDYQAPAENDYDRLARRDDGDGAEYATADNAYDHLAGHQGSAVEYAVPRNNYDRLARQGDGVHNHLAPNPRPGTAPAVTTTQRGRAESFSGFVKVDQAGAAGQATTGPPPLVFDEDAANQDNATVELQGQQANTAYESAVNTGGGPQTTLRTVGSGASATVYVIPTFGDVPANSNC